MVQNLRYMWIQIGLVHATENQHYSAPRSWQHHDFFSSGRKLARPHIQKPRSPAAHFKSLSDIAPFFCFAVALGTLRFVRSMTRRTVLHTIAVVDIVIGVAPLLAVRMKFAIT